MVFHYIDHAILAQTEQIWQQALGTDAKGLVDRCDRQVSCYKCKACAKVISRKNPREVHIDHIIPQKIGGTNVITNLQALCARCNIRKHDTISLLSVKYSGQALVRELRKVSGY